MLDIQNLQKKANLVRKWCLIATTEAGSGHATSALSAADIGTVLFDTYFRYDINNPKNPNNDRFILSKGHASPLLYTLFALSGGLPIEELKTLRKLGSRLEGHPNPRFPYADVATGSLGQGLSVGAGMSLANAQDKALNPKPHVYVLLGDGEMAEGNVWEAANFASYYRLENLIAIVDVNRLGQSQETMFGHNLEEYTQRFSAFGWEVLAIDGHNFEEIYRAFSLAVNNKSRKPFAIVAKTKKGKGISIFEDKEKWHAIPLKKDELEKALPELGDIDDSLRFDLRLPRSSSSVEVSHYPAKPDPGSHHIEITYKKGELVATREAYGRTLSQLAQRNSLLFAFDADLKNSTFAQDFKNACPQRFIECFIAEQNMVSVGLGFWAGGKIPFISTFAAFFTRAFDQIRMAVISGANIKFVGSHAGVSMGQDGPSQMGLEDFALFGSFPNTVIFHPSDALSVAKLLPQMLIHSGISYLRTLRSKTPVMYQCNDEFSIGGSKVLRESKEDLLTIVAAGITVHEALKAYEELKTQQGILVRIIDCYCVKPIDSNTLRKSLQETKKKIIISVEDHFAHGGLGDFVRDAVFDSMAHVEKMAVTKISQSGTQDELLDAAGISANHIVEKVRSML